MWQAATGSSRQHRGCDLGDSRVRWAGGSGRSVSSPLARMEWCQQLGQRSPLQIKQCDIMLGACHRSLNLREGCGAVVTLALGTGVGHTVDKILPCCPGILLMQQWGGCSPSPASSSLKDTAPWALGLCSTGDLGASPQVDCVATCGIVDMWVTLPPAQGCRCCCCHKQWVQQLLP